MDWLKNNFLYIGRFSREKNVFHLLDAYKKIAERNDRWGLILVGNGPQKKRIEDYIQKYGIKNVSLPGFIQKIDIPKFLAVSNILILPSISETWGIVVNEAMAAGLPVLVSRKCGCYPDIVRDEESGFSFNPFDKNQLYNLMREIVDGGVNLKKMGESSLQIIKDYTPERAARIIIDTINCVANMGK
jgi:glycosyltransferase involved in cell wall biosynthesis